MSDFKIKEAIGRYLIVEPFNKSAVLKTTETETVFKVISIGGLVGKSDGNGQWFQYNKININDLIIIAPGSCNRTMMNYQEVYYVAETDIVCTIEA